MSLRGERDDILHSDTTDFYQYIKAQKNRPCLGKYVFVIFMSMLEK